MLAGRIALMSLLVLPWLPTAAAADPNCTCLAKGRSYELGESICLASPKGPRMATCGMVLNNTSWQFSDTPCVISAAPGETERADTAIPARPDGG